jgi:hypothetical protein
MKKSENPEKRMKFGIYSGIEAEIWDLLLKTVGVKMELELLGFRPKSRV